MTRKPAKPKARSAGGQPKVKDRPAKASVPADPVSRAAADQGDRRIPRFASDDDRVTAAAIARWKAIAANVVDDIGGWRDDARERIYRGGWPVPPELFADTSCLIHWLERHHPRIDHSPLTDIYNATMAWYREHSAENVLNQEALVTTLERALLALDVAEQAIIGRATGDARPPAVPSGVPLTADHESILSALNELPARIAGAIQSLNVRDDAKAPAAKLPELRPRDREAWQASLVLGMTQQKIAEKMNEAHPGENWTQPRVSEAIKRAKAHADASGLADKVTATHSSAPARTLDPAAADVGQRTDGRAKHLREKARQIAKEE